MAFTPNTSDRKHIFLTGTPGIGKTTAIRNTIKLLRDNSIQVRGFYTEEVRDGLRSNNRVGFRAVDVSEESRTAWLARVPTTGPSPGGPRVGKYVVDVADFERIALPAMDDVTSGVCVVDEVGKMESFSRKFTACIKRLLDSDKVRVLGTVPGVAGSVKPLQIAKDIHESASVTVVEVTRDNRNDIPQYILGLFTT